MKSNSDQEVELRQINRFINDFWKMIKQFLPRMGSMDDAEWRELLDMASGLSTEYGDRRLCQMLVLTFLDYLDDKDIEYQVAKREQKILERMKLTSHTERTNT